MAITQLDTENADRDLTSIITVLTDTPDAVNNLFCQGFIELGDGAKNLDGTGGDFELTITVGGQTIEPQPQVIAFSTAVRTGVWTTVFPVPANSEVVLRVKSPNGADTDVDVTAYLFDVGADAASIKTAMEADGGDLSSLIEALVNKMLITEATGTAELFNDAGASQGSVTAAFTSIAGVTQRKRIFK